MSGFLHWLKCRLFPCGFVDRDDDGKIVLRCRECRRIVVAAAPTTEVTKDA